MSNWPFYFFSIFRPLLITFSPMLDEISKDIAHLLRLFGRGEIPSPCSSLCLPGPQRGSTETRLPKLGRPHALFQAERVIDRLQH